jgi:hypothetical protein
MAAKVYSSAESIGMPEHGNLGVVVQFSELVGLGPHPTVL